MLYCCKINYMYLGDTVLLKKVRSKREAEEWLAEQGRYFASAVFMKKEYEKRIRE